MESWSIGSTANRMVGRKLGASLSMTYITSIMPTFHNLPRYGGSLAENLIALLAAGHQRIRAKPRFASIYRETRFPIGRGRRSAWSINLDETRVEDTLVCSRRVNFHPWDACPFSIACITVLDPLSKELFLKAEN